MQWSKKTITLSERQLIEHNQVMKIFQGEWKILRRLKALLMLHNWNKVKDILAKLDVSHDSVTDRVNIYISKGLQWLISMNYDWRRISEYEKHKEILVRLITENIYNSYLELYIALEREVWKLETGCPALWKFCKKNEIWVIKNVI